MCIRDRIGHVIERLAPQCGPLAINANGDPARFAGFGLPVLADPVADWPGPLAGVLAGMDWAAAQGARAVVSAAADTPFFPADLVARLTEAGAFALAATPDETGRLRPQPTFGLWPVALRGALAQALAAGQRRVAEWALAEGAQLVAFDAAPFFNINTPQDLAAAEARLAGRTPPP